MARSLRTGLASLSELIGVWKEQSVREQEARHASADSIYSFNRGLKRNGVTVQQPLKGRGACCAWVTQPGPSWPPGRSPLLIDCQLAARKAFVVGYTPSFCLNAECRHYISAASGRRSIRDEQLWGGCDSGSGIFKLDRWHSKVLWEATDWGLLIYPGLKCRGCQKVANSLHQEFWDALAPHQLGALPISHSPYNGSYCMSAGLEQLVQANVLSNTSLAGIAKALNRCWAAAERRREVAYLDLKSHELSLYPPNALPYVHTPAYPRGLEQRPMTGEWLRQACFEAVQAQMPLHESLLQSQVSHVVKMDWCPAAACGLGGTDVKAVFVVGGHYNQILKVLLVGRSESYEEVTPALQQLDLRCRRHGMQVVLAYADNAASAHRALKASFPDLGLGLGGPDHGVRNDLMHFSERLSSTLEGTHSGKAAFCAELQNVWWVYETKEAAQERLGLASTDKQTDAWWQKRLQRCIAPPDILVQRLLDLYFEWANTQDLRTGFQLFTTSTPRAFERAVINILKGWLSDPENSEVLFLQRPDGTLLAVRGTSQVENINSQVHKWLPATCGLLHARPLLAVHITDHNIRAGILHLGHPDYHIGGDLAQVKRIKELTAQVHGPAAAAGRFPEIQFAEGGADEPFLQQPSPELRQLAAALGALPAAAGDGVTPAACVDSLPAPQQALFRRLQGCNAAPRAVIPKLAPAAVVPARPCKKA